MADYVPYTARLTTYNPVALTASFNVNFEIYNDNDVAVFIDTVPTTAFSITSTYSSGVSTDAAVVPDTPADWTNTRVDIVGKRLPRIAEAYADGQGIPAADQNLSLKRVIAIEQEQDRDNDLSLRFPYGTDPTFSPFLPTPVDDTGIRWDATLKKYVTGPSTADIADAAANAAAAASSASAAALSALALNAAVLAPTIASYLAGIQTKLDVVGRKAKALASRSQASGSAASISNSFVVVATVDFIAVGRSARVHVNGFIFNASTSAKTVNPKVLINDSSPTLIKDGTAPSAILQINDSHPVYSELFFNGLIDGDEYTAQYQVQQTGTDAGLSSTATIEVESRE